VIAWGQAGQAFGDARMSGDAAALPSAFSQVIALAESNASASPASAPNPSFSTIEAQLRQALQLPYLNQECPTP
jgi:hypothetical protein